MTWLTIVLLVAKVGLGLAVWYFKRQVSSRDATIAKLLLERNTRLEAANARLIREADETDLRDTESMPSATIASELGRLWTESKDPTK